MNVDAPSTHIVEVPLPSQQRITRRQLELITAIRDYRIRQDGACPSLEDLAQAMKCSRPAVVTKVQALIVKGLLTRQVGVHRSLRCTKPALDVIAFFEAQTAQP